MLTLVARHGRRIQVLSGSDDMYLATLAIGLGENIGQSFLGRVLIRMKLAFDNGDLATARVEQVYCFVSCFQLFYYLFILFYVIF